MVRNILLGVFLWMTITPSAVASPIAGGFLSFDVFIPAGSVPGANSFDLFDLTGPMYGPLAGSTYIATSVTLDNSVLTVTPVSGAPEIFDLGDVGPGELLDPSGNPVVQFPSNLQFTSATLMATLSQTDLMLSDGSTFIANPAIFVNLTPSGGSTLTPGVDLAVIELEPAVETPEAGAASLVGCGLLCLIGLTVRVSRIRRRVRR